MQPKSMMEDDSAGMKMLAKHLADVKLAAEEREYAWKTKVRKLEEENRKMRRDIEDYKAQIRDLQRLGSTKGIQAEHDQWKSLVETPRRDTAELRAELDMTTQAKTLKTRERQQGVSNGNGLARTHSETYPGASYANNSIGGSKLFEDEHGSEVDHDVRAMGEIESLREELNQKDKEIQALRRKLDLELELKWERSRQERKQEGWQTSLLESFTEIVAPLPPQQEFPTQSSSLSSSVSHPKSKTVLLSELMSQERSLAREGYFTV